MTHAPTKAECDAACSALRATCRNAKIHNVLHYLNTYYLSEPWLSLFSDYYRDMPRRHQNVTSLAETSHSMQKSALLNGARVRSNPVLAMRIIHGLPAQLLGPAALLRVVSVLQHIAARREAILRGAADATRTAGVRRMLPRVLQILGAWMQDERRLIPDERVNTLYQVAASSTRTTAMAAASAAPSSSASTAAPDRAESGDNSDDDDGDVVATAVGEELAATLVRPPVVAESDASAVARASAHGQNATATDATASASTTVAAVDMPSEYYLVDVRGAGWCTCPRGRAVPLGGVTLCKHVHAVRLVHLLHGDRRKCWDDHETEYLVSLDTDFALGKVGFGVDFLRALVASSQIAPAHAVADGAAATGPVDDRAAASADAPARGEIAVHGLQQLAQWMQLQTQLVREGGDVDASFDAIAREAAALYHRWAPQLGSVTLDTHFRQPRSDTAARAVMGTRPRRGRGPSRRRRSTGATAPAGAAASVAVTAAAAAVENADDSGSEDEIEEGGADGVSAGAAAGSTPAAAGADVAATVADAVDADVVVPPARHKRVRRPVYVDDDWDMTTD